MPVLMLDTFAVENGKDPIEGSTLPDNFFTKYLENNECIFEGGEDIKSIRSTEAKRAKDVMNGFEEGSVRFVLRPTATGRGSLSSRIRGITKS